MRPLALIGAGTISMQTDFAPRVRAPYKFTTGGGSRSLATCWLWVAYRLA